MTHAEAKKEIKENGIDLGAGDFIDTEALKVAVDALDRLTPAKPIEEANEFDDRTVCCPNCIGPVTNYWAPGTMPKHCQFCGQALDWGEESKDG